MTKSRVPPRAPPPGPDPARARRALAAPHLARRTPAGPPPRGQGPGRTLGIALLVGLGFLIGRLSASTPGAPPPPPRAEEPLTKTSTEAPRLQAATSTIGLCPCPRPAPKRTPVVSRKRRPPLATPPFEAPDPTQATAEKLREAAQQLAACAPSTGGELRVHLEVTVTPEGEVERTRVTNLEPVPAAVGACIEAKLGALELPGFDASESQAFALTVVL